MDFARSALCTVISTVIFAVPVYAAPAFHLQMSLAQEDINGNANITKKLTAAIRYANSLDSNSVLNLNADIYHQTYPDIPGWDSDGLLVEAIYNLVPTAGFTQPMYSIVLRHETSRSDWPGADFTQTTLILADTFRLDDRQSLSVGGELANRSQGQGDARLLGIFLNSDINVTDDLLIYLNLKIQKEDGSTGYYSRYNMTSAGDGNKTNRLFALGMNYTFNAHHSIDLSYQSSKYDLRGLNSDYTLFSLDYFYKF